MSDFDDAIGTMTTDLLTEAGLSVTYVRGNVSSTITLRKSVQPVSVIDTGNGHYLEVRPVDFIGLTTALPYDPPERGDKLIVGGETFEVQPTTSEKVFRRISQQMTRIHTKQVAQ